MVAINLTSLIRITKVKINFVSVFVKPLIAASACGITAWSVNYLLVQKLAVSGRISTVLAIGAAGCVYGVILILIKGIAKDDLEMLPKGEKIAKVLAKFGLLG